MTAEHGLRATIDHDGTEAPFEQLRRQVAEGVADGTYAPGLRLPTVRGLAEALGLAAGTVAKAYRALEADGVVETRGRAGTFVPDRTAPDGSTDAAARAFVLAARRRGLSRDEAVRLLQAHWG